MVLVIAVFADFVGLGVFDCVVDSLDRVSVKSEVVRGYASLQLRVEVKIWVGYLSLVAGVIVFELVDDLGSLTLLGPEVENVVVRAGLDGGLPVFAVDEFLLGFLGNWQ